MLEYFSRLPSKWNGMRSTFDFASSSRTLICRPISTSIHSVTVRCPSHSCFRGNSKSRDGKMVMREDEDEDNDHNYYVGRTVKKFFLGFGYFHGKVISFNRTRKFYKVKYDDGDREELDLKELKELLVDNHQPISLSTAVESKISSSRRGRKRKRDSSGKDGSVPGAGERQYNNTPDKNSIAQKETAAGQLSPLHLEDVRVLNAQTQEIYRQLRGDNNEVGKDGKQHSEDELLLEPLVPVSVVSTFEKGTKQQAVGFDFEPHPGEDEEKRRAGAFGNADVAVGSTSPCCLKRTRVTPASDACLESMPPVEGGETAQINKEVQTDDKMEEMAKTSADGLLPPVNSTEDADLPVWDVENKTDPVEKDRCGGEVHEQEKKTQFSAFFLSLPGPSSRSLGALDGCISELFQVYSLLRSFSNMIFLSPFSLEELAYGLTSTDVCSLIDCVHLSLLQTLRRQLERLSRNGSKSATFTLRLADWSLLDYITWPSFLVGYMLTQGFNFDRGHSDVKSSLSTIGEYYKLPVKTKLIILSFLCDKVLDTDEARAEIGRRAILENDPDTMETKGFAQKKQVKESNPIVHVYHERITGPATDSRSGKDDLSAVSEVVQQETLLSASGANSTRVGRHLDEDGNLDECVLCAMDGNLICCDGCPAAYHSRCVGVTKQGLPPGDWFCPECRADKEDPRGARICKGVRGGELLAIGPDSQFFFYTCGYLLISESGPEGQVMHRYYSPRDLNAVIRLLEEAGPSYAQVLNAAKRLCQVEMHVPIAPDGAALKPPVLEIPPVILCSENELGHHGGPDCSIRTLSEKAIPVEVDKSLPSPSDLLTTGQIKKLDLSVSDFFTNGEPLVSSVVLPPKKERDEKRILLVGDFSNEVNGRQLTSDAVPPLTVKDEKKPHMLSDELRKSGQDELQCKSSYDSLSAELENIWNQHTCLDVPQQIELQTHTSRVGDGQTIVEDRSEKSAQFVDPSTAGAIEIERGPNGIVRSEGLEAGKIGLGIEQEILKGDLTVKVVSASPGIPSSGQQQLSEQKDVNASLKKRALIRNQESGCSDREVDYLSTISQMNACSYTNKYANCDLVATAAFNMAVQAGGVDDLVDDKSGAMKKYKPTSVAEQLKAFTQASSHFFWPSVKKRAKDVPKEKCGWCLNCRSTGRRGCLLTQVAGQMAGGAALVVGGIRPIKGGIGHFPAVAAYILYMEENLHGLLEGPWEFSGHRKKWRKQVEQTKSLKDINLALLQMESSMRKVVLSQDWDKVEEDAPESIASSAIIISTAGVEKSGKKAVPRKRGRPSVVAKIPAITSYDGACFGVKWWRGGSLSRKVYNWESLTRTALQRAGRQGGFKEIPDLVYSKSLDLPRRTRQFAWRTRLEKISSIAQVAVEVRYLDTFIKWNDIISPLEASTTHHVKVPTDIEPAFQKAEILRIKSEGGIVKYLVSFPTDTDEKIDTSTQQQQDVPQKGVGASAEKSNSKKHQAAPKDGANEEWVAEGQVPLFLLKAFVEKRRSENQSEPPKSLKKGKVKVSNQRKKLTFWKMLCSPRLSGMLESKKLSGLICGYCKMTCSESQRVRCRRCSAEFHRNCTQVEDFINGQEKVYVCKSCIQLRLGPRMRKPSYKMLVMHSQLSDGSPAGFSKEEIVANMEGASTGGVKRRWKKDKSTSPPNCDLFGKKKKKRLLSMPTPSQIDCESIWMEEKSRKKKKKKKGVITVFPWQYEGESTPGGKKKAMKKALPMEEPDLPQAKKNRGRKTKGVSLVHSQTEQMSETPRRTSGRIRNSISPSGAIPLPITEHQSPRKSKKRKLDEELVQPEKSMSTRRRSVRKKDSPAAAENENGGGLVGNKPSVKRKRLKIIFAGLEVAGQNVNSNGGLEEDRKRKSGNGLDFGCRSAKSESEIQRFRLERVVLEAQVLLDERKVPVCGTCAVRYSPGQVFVSCEYCNVWYHGAAVGLKQGDVDYLVGLKCHRCRKCRAPSCPAQQNTGVRARRKGAIDPGEVIDAETVNRVGQFESSSLQSSWFSSPDKEFSAFGDSRAFPEFASATNQAEEALNGERSNFAHVLSHDFDMSDLVLPGDSQIQLNPLSLDDQQVNEWATNESGQLDLPGFCVSQADLSSQSAAQLSFTELLASEDDIFEGVPGSGLGLSAEWSGGMYGPGTLARSESLAADITAEAGVANNSFVDEDGTVSGSASLVAPFNHREADIITNAGFDSFSSVKAHGNLFGSATLYPPLKDPAADTITTNAGYNNYAALVYANGTACQTTLPLKNCGNDYYIEQKVAPTVQSGEGEMTNIGSSSAASR